MSIAKRKLAVYAVGAPLASLTGSLTLYSSGIDYSELLSTLLGSGGIIKSLSAWADVTHDKENTSLNPAYFLWKAQ